MDENEQIIRRWFSEVWNDRNAAKIDELRQPDATSEGLLPNEKHEGNNRFKHFHKLICSAFSDINFTVETAASQGNRLTAEWSGTMVHTGVFQDRAPTGKRVSVRGTYEGTVVDGKIANGKNTWNYADILRQIDF
jgi:predicted ester cyclase